MKKIFKYIVSESVEMHENAEILSVQMQNDDLCIWAIVDPESPKVMKHFTFIGTGQEPPNLEIWEFLVTIQNGPLVWHFFRTKS